ncbi:SKI/SNO/DAC family protein [Dictyocaulus viviparus]|uniref:SKI/SNO/DAC family protein n=1 Tax=Dictyocaulus viviparus TaxID=29172 RepID=A0A0D8X7S2_DICVI|nr:SKI/SNO/DAC family protein [Dictyocaulus viviparus]
MISGQSSIVTEEFLSFDSSETAIPKEINYRGQTVVGFDLKGTDMLCLPQVYELFLKNMVGGLHTVYTKLKRLEITPIICNVEQVRALRSKNAIQPGVNRCKLIAATDFDRLYDDCTNTCTRPGRPPKRWSNVEEWSVKREKFRDLTQRCGVETDYCGVASVSSPNSVLFGQFLPQFNAQQLLVQQMMLLAATQKQSEICGASSSLGISTDAATIDGGIPLNLSKSTSNSETSDNDSLENMQKEGNISPNQSISFDRGVSNGSNNSSSSSEQSTDATTKIISLIDMASDYFKQQMESIRKEKEEIEFLRCQLKGSLIDGNRLREQLRVEKKKSNIYFRRYCKARREMILLREQMSDMRNNPMTSTLNC